MLLDDKENSLPLVPRELARQARIAKNAAIQKESGLFGASQTLQKLSKKNSMVSAQPVVAEARRGSTVCSSCTF
jgi:hypothetical protein